MYDVQQAQAQRAAYSAHRNVDHCTENTPLVLSPQLTKPCCPAPLAPPERSSRQQGLARHAQAAQRQMNTRTSLGTGMQTELTAAERELLKLRQAACHQHKSPSTTSQLAKPCCCARQQGLARHAQAYILHEPEHVVRHRHASTIKRSRVAATQGLCQAARSSITKDPTHLTAAQALLYCTSCRRLWKEVQYSRAWPDTLRPHNCS